MKGALDPHMSSTATLSSAMEAARGYYGYLLSHLSPFLGKRVMEVGAGYGQLSVLLAESGRQVLSTDSDAQAVKKLQGLLDPGKAACLVFNACGADNATLSAIKVFSPDTILCVNVLEHISDDLATLELFHRILPKGGKLVLLVPAHAFLFNVLDKEAGHCRRYGKTQLLQLVEKAGWRISSWKFINAIGIAGWILAGMLNRGSKQNALESGGTKKLVSWFSRFLIPAARLVDSCLFKITGLSLIVSAVKEEG